MSTAFSHMVEPIFAAEGFAKRFGNAEVPPRFSPPCELAVNPKTEWRRTFTETPADSTFLDCI
ncbi:hypothetical protein [Candidatus Palauibacter sp.]|uniref:hypothetical protein n=1 Tax=Candidatus Palauibacter sp. TaxID=3101350 RepID=UPI003B52B604